MRGRAGCLSVRNRNLMVLARSKLRLASLTIGNTTTNALGKPRITNQARRLQNPELKKQAGAVLSPCGEGASAVHDQPGAPDACRRCAGCV